MAKRYCSLTEYIPLLRDENQEDWVVDKKSKGAADYSVQSALVQWFRWSSEDSTP